MKKVYLFVVLVLMLSLSLAACGGSDQVEEDASAAEAPAAEEAGAPAEGDVVEAFVFTNTGTVDICELYLSPVTTEDWGTDQLAGQTITAGGTFTLKNIPADSYDAKAVGCNDAGESIVQLDIFNP